MTGGQDLGAYMLGASIAKSGAETKARIQRENMRIEHEAELDELRATITALRDRNARLTVSFFEQSIFAEVRRKVISALRGEAEKASEVVPSGVFSRDAMLKAMPVHFDNAKRGEMMEAFAVQVAEDIAKVNSEHERESIRQALERFVKWLRS